MKSWLKLFLALPFGLFVGTAAMAQQSPIMTVSITEIDVSTGGGGPLSSIAMVSGGTGYTSTPTVVISGGGGTGATATATVASGAVTGIVVNTGGSGYTSTPTVSIIGGGGSGATATATISLPVTTYIPPNERSGPAGSQILIQALAVGTNPAGKFTYTFFINGQTLGTPPNPNNGFPAIVGWTPPQPGVYFITVTASDGANTSTSLAIRYFATGTVINSPSDNTLVPQGSSVVIKADATGASSFIQKIDFYDNGTLIGTDTTLPYSIIYTVPGVAGSTHSITAKATDNNGAIVAPGVSAAITLNVVNAIGGTSTTSAISSPSNGSAIPIGGVIPITVDAHSAAGVITKVELYIDGVLFGTNTTFPYTFNWTPSVVGTYHLVALAYDDKNNVIASTTSTSPTSTPAPTAVKIAAPPTITITQPVSGATVPGGSNVQVIASATDSEVDPNGNPITISSVQFFLDGTFVGVANAPTPAGSSNYTTTFVPKPKLDSAGNALPSSLTALAIDSIGSSKLSSAVSISITSGGSGGSTTVIGLPPVVSVVAPTNNSLLPVGSVVNLSASASDPDGTIASVQFIANGQTLSTVSSFPYNATWTPTALGSYSITAKATDDKGNTTTSTPVVVTITGNGAPTVALTSPANGTVLTAGVPINVTATASDFDGTVTSVRFTANGITIGTVSSAPYVVSWTPSASGTYTLVAQATDNSGNFTNSTAVTVTVGGNGAPSVSITSPTVGSGVLVGSAVTVSATASDSDGVVKSVQFFANGVSIGTKTTPPYTVSWTPQAEGIYHLTAVATDNANLTTVSTDVGVLGVTATGTSSANVYTGSYQNGFETGKMALMSFGGKTVTLIGHSSTGNKIYFYSSIPMDSSGNFTLTANGQTVSGTVSTGSATATITNGTSLLLFIGISPTTTGSAFAASGYYTGNLSGRPSSMIAAIVGVDSSIMLYLKDGTFADVGDSRVDATGAFTVLTSGGNTFVGRIDPATGFLTGKLSGSTAADATGALSSGGSFSDGALRNLSTRGQVGTGGNVLITGFIVGGTTAKRVLIRAVGPGLIASGITNALADPQLQVYDSSGTPIAGAYNNDWNLADAPSMSSVGAFPLTPSSKDAALITTLAPGIYTTQVSGVGGTTGVALIEFYDLDAATPFSQQKVVNVSTRGVAGSGQNALIAGFGISGNSSKMVLLRAVGGQTLATLAGVPVGSVLADPILSLQRKQSDGSYVTVRENDNWEAGNDATLVAAAASKAGAFPLPSGSKDAVMLISLPPGIYTTVVSGNGGGSGIALVEVYEVP
ncbi:MAG TPA: Ig-like domain-containing protein [Opitutaceae bacterium]|nr:Ig-like domain-containing protein [Opitutaceae bacterium]